MYTKLAALALFAFSAQLATAANSPACLLQAVNSLQNNTVANACGAGSPDVQSAIQSLCGSNVAAAKSQYSDSCSSASKTSSASTTATGTKSTSATASASITGSATGSSGSSYGAANSTIVITSTYFDTVCSCTKTATTSAVGGGATGFATGASTSKASGTGVALATGTGSAPIATFTGAASKASLGSFAAAAVVMAGFAIALRLTVLASGKQHTVDQRLHEKYGPIVRGGPNTLHFSGLEAFKVIYGFKNFGKTDFYILSGDPEREKFNLFQTQGEEQHRVRRKQLAFPSFSAKAIASYEPIITRNLSLWLDRVSEDLPPGGGDLRDVAHRIRFLTMDMGMACRLVMSGPVTYKQWLIQALVTEIVHGSSKGYLAADHDLQGMIAEKEEITRIMNIIPQVHWLGRLVASKPVWSRITKPKFDKEGRLLGLGVIPEFSSKAFHAALAEGSKFLAPSVLKGFLETPPDEAKAWGNEQRLGELGSLQFAGTGSSTAGLCASIYHLGMHPSWQQSILSEITELLISEPASASPSLLFSKLSKSASLRAVIKESLRVTPPFQSVFERQVGKGAEAAIPGLLAPLPLGTRVGCNLYVINRNKIIFGEDADEWKPERWLIDDGVELRLMEDAWAVFGRGARMCVAKDIALMFLTKAVGEMVLRWEITVKEGSMKSINAFDMQVRELPVSLKVR
ncbi:MAG: hypothetical protein M1812_005616 [Candelaria pacifica]|nr:MAG: hypothetical protein M1812_005616 [Candelaria pacifica]